MNGKNKQVSTNSIQTKNDKEYLVLSYLSILGLAILFSTSLETTYGTYEYWKANNTLFIGSILVVLFSLTLQIKNKTRNINTFIKIYRKEKVSKSEKANLIWLVSFTIAVIGIFFADTSFASGNGRLGIGITFGFARTFALLLSKD